MKLGSTIVKTGGACDRVSAFVIARSGEGRSLIAGNGVTRCSLFLSRAAALVLLAGFAGVPAIGQAPDCVIPFTFTAAAQRSQLGGCGKNLQGLIDWRAVYINNGFTAVSVNIQSAPDSTGSAGAWVNFVGTAVAGVNPMTATTYSSAEVNGFNPWVSVTLASKTGTGTVSGVLYGCRQPGCATGSLSGLNVPCAGTIASPCVVDGPDAQGAAATKSPVQVAGYDGTNVQRFLVCTSSAIVDDSTMGNIQIIAASGSTRVRICKLSLTTAAGVDVQLKQGTGANCGTGTANLSGVWQNAATIAEDFITDQSVLIGAASQAVCLNLGAATRTTGVVFYAQF